MLKNVSLMVTHRCNSRCQMCNIWKGSCAELQPKEFGCLFAHAEFSEIEDLSITGGEPTLRADLLELVDAVTGTLPKLRMLFLCTNGTNVSAADAFVGRYSPKVEQVFVATSIEGEEPVHRLIRGIGSYQSALDMLRRCRRRNGDVRTIISMTLTKYNCNPRQIEHVKHLAASTGSTYTFKPVVVSPTYFGNRADAMSPSVEQLLSVASFVDELRARDPFMEVQWEYWKTGKLPMLQEDGGRIRCLAGDVFAFVRPTGEVFPCCMSSRKIGDLEHGVSTQPLIDLGSKEACPCCQEMCIYPQINWREFSSWSGCK